MPIRDKIENISTTWAVMGSDIVTSVSMSLEDLDKVCCLIDRLERISSKLYEASIRFHQFNDSDYRWKDSGGILYEAHEEYKQLAKELE